MSEQASLVKATQRIADLFWTMASDEDGAVSWYKSTFYAGSSELLTKAIETTYPGVDAEKVQEIMSESGESVADSVAYWREHDARHEWCTIEHADDHMAYCYTHGTDYTY